jgi:HK97 family phage major capsid protein
MSDQVLLAVQEHAQVIEQFKSAVDGELKAIKSAQATQRNQMIDLAQKGGIPNGFSGMPKDESVASQFVQSTQFKSMLSGAPTTGRVEVKATVTSVTHDVQAARKPGLFNNPQRALSLLSVLPSLAVNTGVFEFMQLNGYSNAAAVQVAEGDLKAEASLPTAVVQANISTIAHWIKASNQILADAPALSMQIDNLLRYGVQAKVEGELINGVGGAGKILGLVPQATAFVPTLTAKADQIGEAKAAMEAAGWVPSIIVMNPTDWFVVASERATDEQYVLGSPRDPAGPGLWGIPVLTTPAIASGTSLILDQSQVAVLTREGVTVMASREDGTNFTTNQTTILAEARYGLAVFATGAARKIVDVI